MSVGLVLSAGGVRGAYQVGVLQGIVEVLGCGGERGRAPLFDVLSGTSIGAVNCAFLAAHAHRRDHAVGELARIWRTIELAEALAFAPLDLLRGRALFSPRLLERLVEREIPWPALHAHVRSGVVRALAVAVFDVADGRTTLFAELAPDVRLRPSAYPVRRTLREPITPDILLASAALPLVYPAREIRGRYYVDGALRFNTPIEPALSADVDRVVVVSLLHRTGDPAAAPVTGFPNMAMLLGKALNSVLLDPIVWDLENLRRTNHGLRVLAEVLSPDELARVQARLEAEQVLRHRPVPLLAFQPSEDIGKLTAAFIRDELDETSASWPLRAAIRALSRSDLGHEADIASILLLDGRFAARLLELGRRDAHAAAGDIRAFFV